MGECYLGGVGGKKCASGTFIGAGEGTHNISLDFTPKFVSCHLQSTVESSSSIGDNMRVLSFDFSNNKGFIAYRTFMGSDLQVNLGYSGNSANRPTFSSGTLSLGVGGFKSGATYTWFASE